MNTWRWIKYIWFLFLAITPLLPLWLSNQWLLTILGPSYLLWLANLLYDHSDWFYFHATRLMLWVSNEEVAWSLAADWSETNADPTQAVYTVLRQAYPDAVLWQNSPTEKIIKLPLGCVVRMRQTSSVDSLSQTEQGFLLEIADLVVPFRRSTRMLDELIALLDQVRPLLTPASENYRFRVTMAGANPYFGLFVRRLRVPQQQLKSFICEFSERVGPITEDIQVGENRIALVAHSLSSLQTLSRRYVTLATLDLTNSA